MNRRDFAIGAATLLGVPLASTPATVAAATLDTIRIGVTTLNPAHAIFAAAKELGFYARANVDTQIRAFSDGPAALELLASGNLDLCPIVPASAVAALGKGVKVQIVADFAPARPAGWYVLVPAGSSITSLGELNGRTVGVALAGSTGDGWVQRIARSAKIAIATVPLGADTLAGMRAKKADAVLVGPLASYKALLSGDLRSIASLELLLPPSIYEGVGASGDLIALQPALLRRWLSATSAAIGYMQSHEAWTEAFLKTTYGESDDAAIAMTFDGVIRKIDPAGAMHRDWKKTALLAPAGTTTLMPAERVFSTAFVPVRGR